MGGNGFLKILINFNLIAFQHSMMHFDIMILHANIFIVHGAIFLLKNNLQVRFLTPGACTTYILHDMPTTIVAAETSGVKGKITLA